ncbi:MFS transporter [Reinekea blandensis]|nr:MFS transporter [Reinekea blandensis]
MLGLNRNVWILAMTQPLALAMSPAIVLISGFVGKSLAPRPELSTLPLSMMIIGITLGAMPAALLMQRFGRKRVFLAGMVINSLAALIAAGGIALSSFIIFLLGITLSGMTIAIMHQFRFAAAESTPAELAGRAISMLMLGSVAAAFIGTELAAFGQDWFATPYAGSFLALIAASVAGFILLCFYQDNTRPEQSDKDTPPVNWSDVLRRPTFLIALGSAAIGYGVMSFVMTATPLAMHDMMGHSLGDTKWVIQSHIMAMFLPSLVTGELIRKFGERTIIFVGLLAYLATTAFAYSGVEVLHYWWALVLLGVGWNFLFIGGTTLLTKAYKPHEKFRVQAVNDLTVFVFQALSSLSAGVILFLSGWSGIVTLSLVPTAVLLIAIGLTWTRIKSTVAAESQAS